LTLDLALRGIARHALGGVFAARMGNLRSVRLVQLIDPPRLRAAFRGAVRGACGPGFGSGTLPCAHSSRGRHRGAPGLTRQLGFGQPVGFSRAPSIPSMTARGPGGLPAHGAACDGVPAGVSDIPECPRERQAVELGAAPTGDASHERGWTKNGRVWSETGVDRLTSIC
jgi:hypothetical protein